MNSKVLLSFSDISLPGLVLIFPNSLTSCPSQRVLFPGQSDKGILMGRRAGWSRACQGLSDSVFSLLLAFCSSARHEAISLLRELWLLSRLSYDLCAHTCSSCKVREAQSNTLTWILCSSWLSFPLRFTAGAVWQWAWECGKSSWSHYPPSTDLKLTF